MKFIVILLIASTCFATEFLAGQKVEVLNGFYKGCTGYINNKASVGLIPQLYELNGVYCRTRPMFNIIINEDLLQLIK